MSGNPNPTKCGNCGTENPPNQEFCRSCQAPLTISADADALEPALETPDEPSNFAGGGGDMPESGIVGGIGGAPISVPTEPRYQDRDEPPRRRGGQ